MTQLEAAAREARATLHVALERLQVNDLQGEEAPFIEDCETAIKMIEDALRGDKP